MSFKSIIYGVHGRSPLIRLRGINELYARRFEAKHIEDQTFATESYVAQVSAFLTTYSVLKQQGMPDATIKSIMDSLLANVTQNLQSVSNLTQSLGPCTQFIARTWTK
jgi:hypothetical protein